MVDVDMFIEQSTKIARKSKTNSKRSVEARQEARVLRGQFEKYLEAELKASDSPRTRLDSTANEEQLIEIPVT